MKPKVTSKKIFLKIFKNSKNSKKAFELYLPKKYIYRER